MYLIDLPLYILEKVCFPRNVLEKYGKFHGLF